MNNTETNILYNSNFSLRFCGYFDPKAEEKPIVLINRNCFKTIRKQLYKQNKGIYLHLVGFLNSHLNTFTIESVKVKNSDLKDVIGTVGIDLDFNEIRDENIKDVEDKIILMCHNDKKDQSMEKINDFSFGLCKQGNLIPINHYIIFDRTDKLDQPKIPFFDSRPIRVYVDKNTTDNRKQPVKITKKNELTKKDTITIPKETIVKKENTVIKTEEQMVDLQLDVTFGLLKNPPIHTKVKDWSNYNSISLLINKQFDSEIYDGFKHKNIFAIFFCHPFRKPYEEDKLSIEILDISMTKTQRQDSLVSIFKTLDKNFFEKLNITKIKQRHIGVYSDEDNYEQFKNFLKKTQHLKYWTERWILFANSKNCKIVHSETEKPIEFELIPNKNKGHVKHHHVKINNDVYLVFEYYYKGIDISA